jgi:hypothetical protein
LNDLLDSSPPAVGDSRVEGNPKRSQ